MSIYTTLIVSFLSQPLFHKQLREVVDETLSYFEEEDDVWSPVLGLLYALEKHPKGPPFAWCGYGRGGGPEERFVAPLRPLFHKLFAGGVVLACDAIFVYAQTENQPRCEMWEIKYERSALIMNSATTSFPLMHTHFLRTKDEVLRWKSEEWAPDSHTESP